MQAHKDGTDHVHTVAILLLNHAQGGNQMEKS